MNPPKPLTDEEQVDEAYRIYARAQVTLWTNRVSEAKKNLQYWHTQAHARTKTEKTQ